MSQITNDNASNRYHKIQFSVNQYGNSPFDTNSYCLDDGLAYAYGTLDDVSKQFEEKVPGNLVTRIFSVREFPSFEEVPRKVNEITWAYETSHFESGDKLTFIVRAQNLASAEKIAKKIPHNISGIDVHSGAIRRVVVGDDVFIAFSKPKRNKCNCM